jgi:hypothetical protein
LIRLVGLAFAGLGCIGLRDRLVNRHFAENQLSLTRASVSSKHVWLMTPPIKTLAISDTILTTKHGNLCF